MSQHGSYVRPEDSEKSEEQQPGEWVAKLFLADATTRLTGVGKLTLFNAGGDRY